MAELCIHCRQRPQGSKQCRRSLCDTCYRATEIRKKYQTAYRTRLKAKAEAAKARAEEANKLAESCIPMAHMLAGKAARHAYGDEEEFVSVAMETLVEASRRFDPSKGVKFVTFAYRSISLRLLETRRISTSGMPSIENMPSTVLTRRHADFLRVDIRDAIRHLSCDELELVRMQMDGMTLIEMGKKLGGLGKNAMSARWAKVRRKLKKLLEVCRP